MIFTVNICRIQRKIRNAIAVHQDTALVLRQNFRKSQSQTLAIFASYNMGDIYAFVLKIFRYIITEPVVGNCRKETTFPSQSGQSDCRVGRRTTHIFLKCRTLCQRLEIIYWIKINCNTSKKNHIVGSSFWKLDQFTC